MTINESRNSNKFTLTRWKKIQAAMLYQYASRAYLMQLQSMVKNLTNGVIDPLIDLAKLQGRDSVLVDARWGSRNTTENWSAHAWPFLKEFQNSLTKDVANRTLERYSITGANQCLRGLDEYSTNWMTPDEEKNIKKLLQEISSYSYMIDMTCDAYSNSLWTDSGFAFYRFEMKSNHPYVNKFRLRTDIEGESGKVPPRTGVYISQDDPHAAAQFAWIGHPGGRLRPARTFNDIGLDALRAVGRNDLWLDEDKMLAFALSDKYPQDLKSAVYFHGEPHKRFAPGMVSSNSFTNRPCKWYFVEKINDEYEDFGFDAILEPQQPGELRVEGGNPCPAAGIYFTPARADSRRAFAEGELMPTYDSAYGKTIWQRDTTNK